MPPIWPSCDATLMILPCLRSSMPGSTNLVHRKTPRRLTARTRSHSATSSSAKALWLNVPASLTRMSTWPNSARAASTMARTCCSSETSVRTRSERRPDSAIDDSTGAATSAASRSAMTTSAPSAANAIAIWPPMPRAPPVTIAVLPLSFPATLMSLDSDYDPAGRWRCLKPGACRCPEMPRWCLVVPGGAGRLARTWRARGSGRRPELADHVRGRQVEPPGHEVHRCLMLGRIVAGDRVGDNDDVVIGEHRVTRRGLHAALGRAPGHHHGLDPVAAQEQVEIGAPERAGPVLLHH